MPAKTITLTEQELDVVLRALTFAVELSEEGERVAFHPDDDYYTDGDPDAEKAARTVAIGLRERLGDL